jgi:hypothetical protein
MLEMWRYRLTKRFSIKHTDGGLSNYVVLTRRRCQQSNCISGTRINQEGDVYEKIRLHAARFDAPTVSGGHQA